MKKQLTMPVKTAIFIIALVITTIGDSLAMKGAIGTNAYEAFSLTVSQASGIKVGTIAMILNIAMVVLQIILEKKVRKQHLLEIPLAVFQGWLLNLFYYAVFDRLTLNSYPARLVCELIGFVLIAMGCAALVYLDLIVFPLEAACSVICERFKLSFARIRQGADILFIVLSVLISLLLRQPFNIREGTLIGMIVLGPMMNLFINFMKKHFG
ncbi:MAG: hypothetical protein IJM79_03140 [Erysipelotrichaceae bacterium]|nr:hypothetical protein [Erysipelotrichaceae bacterium]